MTKKAFLVPTWLQEWEKEETMKTPQELAEFYAKKMTKEELTREINALEDFESKGQLRKAPQLLLNAYRNRLKEL